MKNLFIVFAGGGIGSVLRYWVGMKFPSLATNFPWSTFGVNVLGSFLIGFLIAYFSKSPQSQQLYLLLVVGFCGGFTTFSTFSRESFLFLQQQQWSLFLIYTFVSLCCCILATALGFVLMK